MLLRKLQLIRVSYPISLKQYHCFAKSFHFCLRFRFVNKLYYLIIYICISPHCIQINNTNIYRELSSLFSIYIKREKKETAEESNSTYIRKLNLLISGIKHAFPGGASGKETACQCRRCKRFRFNGKFCDGSLEFHLGKGPRQRDCSVGNTSDCCFLGPRLQSPGHIWQASNSDLLQYSHKKRGFDHIYWESIMGEIKNAQFIL